MATQDNAGDGKIETTLPDTGGAARFRWLTEDTILNIVFRTLIVSAVVFLIIDFRQIYEEANAPLPGETERQEPVVMEPPSEDDQVRPYLPLTTPMRRSGKAPQMPGYAEPPGHEQVAAAMTFRRGPGGAASAIGRIEPGTGAAFEQFLEGQGDEIRTVFLHSPGGSVRDALQMSKLIRQKAIDTRVPENGYCASSCPIVLSGGETRIAARDSWVGVHQIYAAASSPGDLNDGLSSGQSISADIQSHLVEMGVDARAWIHAMQTPSNQLYVFTYDELTEYNLVTELSD